LPAVWQFAGRGVLRRRQQETRIQIRCQNTPSGVSAAAPPPPSKRTSMEEEKAPPAGIRHSFIRVPFVDGSHSSFPGGLGPPQQYPIFVATQWDFVIPGGGRGYKDHERSMGIFSPRPYIHGGIRHSWTVFALDQRHRHAALLCCNHEKRRNQPVSTANCSPGAASPPRVHPGLHAPPHDLRWLLHGAL